MAEAIADHRAERLSDLEYLRRAEELAELARSRGETGRDPRLAGRDTASAYRGLLHDSLGETLGEVAEAQTLLTTAALTFDNLIEQRKIRDWHSNIPVRNAMIDAMDDHLFDLERTAGRRIPHTVLDVLFEKVLSVARRRDGACEALERGHVQPRRRTARLPLCWYRYDSRSRG